MGILGLGVVVSILWAHPPRRRQAHFKHPSSTPQAPLKHPPSFLPLPSSFWSSRAPSLDLRCRFLTGYCSTYVFDSFPFDLGQIFNIFLLIFNTTRNERTLQNLVFYADFLMLLINCINDYRCDTSHKITSQKDKETSIGGPFWTIWDQKTAPKGLMDPLWSSMGPPLGSTRGPKEIPEGSQAIPKGPQEDPRGPQGNLKMTHRDPEGTPRDPLGVPKRSPKSPKG